MPDLDLAALKALAEKATKGRRTTHFIEDIPSYWVIESGDDGLVRIGETDREEDAHLAAACDPDTILALIAEIEAVRARRCEDCGHWYMHNPSPSNTKTGNDTPAPKEE